jgi:hypothetical protein
MKRSYCTIFDKNYLFQALTLFRSLQKYGRDFTCYMLCMDEASYTLLTKMNLENMVPVNVEDIMTPELQEVRQKANYGQFCWVCQPVVCLYILDTFQPEMVIYQEADALFFADPEILLKEMEGYSVSQVPHNYSPQYDNTDVAGKFCVQFNAFRNNKEGRNVLQYWKQECFRYDKEKPTYYPGQICLDNWETMFPGVRVIANPGAGVAPWNVQKFYVHNSNGNVMIDDRHPVVFYHYHAFGRYRNGSFELGAYELSEEVRKLIYATYVHELIKSESLVHQTDPTFTYKRLYDDPKTLVHIFSAGVKTVLLQLYRNFKRKRKGTYNIVKPSWFAGVQN